MVAVSNWMHVDIFAVDQASALWCEFDPTLVSILSSKNPPEFAATKQLLVGAILSGEVWSDSTRNPLSHVGNHSETLIPRSELENFAHKKGLFPSFLFNTLAPFSNAAFPSFPSATSFPSKPNNVQLETVVNKGGRPSEYDWDSFMLEIVRRANDPDGLPDSQAELIREMQLWFSANYDAEPAESSIKNRISKIYKYLTEAKSKDKNPGA